MTHPNGILYLASLLFLVIYFDRGNIRWIHVVAAAAPYLAAPVIWSAYFLQNPADFIAQFGSNARRGLRGLTINRGRVIKGEALRYVKAYGLGAAGERAWRAVKIVMLLA
jgi:uncharacterized membrane protein